MLLNSTVSTFFISRTFPEIFIKIWRNLKIYYKTFILDPIHPTAQPIFALFALFSREPDIFLTCSFRSVIEDLFSTTKSTYQSTKLLSKNTFLGHFGPFLPKFMERDFFLKNRFCVSWPLTSCVWNPIYFSIHS